MSVSLNTVGSALGKTGSVVLADAVENGYTRTHGASGYKRINPFEVENGDAPSEFVAPHTLGDWQAYSHTLVNSGSALEETSLGYRSVHIAWSLPAGYSRDPAHLTQKVYAKSMGATQDLSVNPFSSPDTVQDAGDGTTHTLTGLTAGEWYAIGVKVEWDDSVDTHTNADSLGYDTKAGETPLLGAGRGISTSGPVYDNSPTIDSVVQLTDPGSCIAGCTSCVDIRINVTMQGSSQGTLQEKIGAGSWSDIDTGVPAGSSQLNLTRDAQKDYYYRLRYNDVSPDTWSNTGHLYTDCTLT